MHCMQPQSLGIQGKFRASEAPPEQLQRAQYKYEELPRFMIAPGCPAALQPLQINSFCM